MDIPNFPECDHAIVKALFEQSDYSLVQRLQEQPGQGRYFTALFCRYSPVVYSLIRHSARSPVQSDYLFALTWRHILNELSGIALPPTADNTSFSLQGWLVNITAACINQTDLPEVENIHYSLSDASPPLWCYVSRSLDQLKPVHRLMVLMAQTFHWSDTRIAAYLQAEGTRISPEQVRQQLTQAYRLLESALPEDIRAVYLSSDTPGPVDDDLSDFLDLSGLDLSPATGQSRPDADLP
ncbi:MAG: sigma-70 family RNA polymerase sigma factor [Cyanobacteria bacterium P01_A01_bin.105]